MNKKSTMKQILNFVLYMLLLLAYVLSFSIPVFATTSEFAGGTGTEEDPYLIETKAHLNNVRYHLTSNFKMIADIEFSSTDFAEDGDFYNDGQGWLPIGLLSDGSVGEPFIGVFNGNMHSIKNLYINAETDKYTKIGLFADNCGSIENLGIKDSQIMVTISNEAGVNAGSIAADNYGTVTNCYNTGDISVCGVSALAYAGGISGANNCGSISNCYNMGTIVATNCSGGIVGINLGGNIENCFNTGYICATDGNTGFTYAGGIVGDNDNKILTCYNIGTVISCDYEGGIAGKHFSSGATYHTAAITNCYYSDNVSAGVGRGSVNVSTTKCVFEDMSKPETYVGFDFDTVWTMSGHEKYFYPELTYNPITTLSVKTIIQPKSTSVFEGEKAKVSVEAIGEGLTYQWWFKDTTHSKFYKASVTKPTYSVTMNDTRNGRQLYCVITDAYGNAVTSDTVTINQFEELEIVSQPTNTVAVNGEKATVSVEAVGEGLTYQWYFKNAGATKFSKASTTTDTYSVTMSDARNGRELYCVITDEFGNTLTTETVVILNKLTVLSQPESVIVPNGQKAITTVDAIGVGELTYQWWQKDTNQNKFYKSSVTKPTYSITMSDARNARQLYCVITDEAGNTVTTETIVIANSLAIVSQPNNVAVTNGKKATVSVDVISESDVKYQWYFKNAGATKFSKASNTTDTYSVTMSDARAGREVYCVITDADGNKVTTETVVITNTVAIISQPVSVFVATGEKAMVSVDAIGVGELTYQWYVKNPGGSKFSKSSVSSSKYSVTMTSARNGRQVYCVITDENGNTMTTETVTLAMS